MSLRTLALLGTCLLLVPSPLFAQDAVTVTELDAAATNSQDEAWYATAETGQEEIGWQAAQAGLEFMLLFSPDGHFLVVGEPMETGLDVVAYQLFLVSLEEKRIDLLSELALGATFAPTSDYILIATGPHPVLFNIATRTTTELEPIDSGVENYPVWVANWSADGKEFTLHQQQRFDSPAEPGAWTVRIE